MPKLPIDVHKGLRVFWRDGVPKYSAESGVDVVADVERAIDYAQMRINWLAEWLNAYKAALDAAGGA